MTTMKAMMGRVEPWLCVAAARECSKQGAKELHSFVLLPLYVSECAATVVYGHQRYFVGDLMSLLLLVGQGRRAHRGKDRSSRVMSGRV